MKFTTIKLADGEVPALDQAQGLKRDGTTLC